MSRLAHIFLPVLAAVALASAVTSCGSGSRATSAHYRGDALYGDDDRRGKSHSKGHGKGHGDRHVPPILESFAKGLSDPLEKALVTEIESWLGTPYQWGGHSKEGTDCSGMVMEVYGKVTGLKLPRVSREQSAYVAPLSRNALHPGDLLFFSGDTTLGEVSHVGMYVGRGQMIHASVSRGVVVSDIDQRYWSSRLCNSGRVAGAMAAWRDRGGKTSMPDPAPRPSGTPEISLMALTSKNRAGESAPVPASSAGVHSAAQSQPRGGSAIVPHEVNTSVDTQTDLDRRLEMAITEKADSIFSSRFMD